jgi:methionyl-tRNA formyltransferase
MNNSNNTKFAFFGSSRLSVIVLDELSKLGLLPQFIVTTHDKPVGRKQILTPNVVKTWASEKNIPYFDPERLDSHFINKIKEIITKEGVEVCPVFLVASYGKILPENLIEIPSKKTLNIHPSLLPQYRGASPLPTTILDDTKNTGVSIMVLDNEMDHGPIVAQKNITIETWPNYLDFEEMMARQGAQLFAEILPRWTRNEIQAQEQDHSKASYTKKFSKGDGLLELMGDPYTNWLKFQAFYGWLGCYFVTNRNGKDLRIKITDAKYDNGKFEIIKVIPEGSKEMSYVDFCRGNK